MSRQLINQCLASLKSKPKQPQDASRNFFFGSANDRVTTKSFFETNFIKTSRYTLITFFPVSLLNQFRRYANIYFLLSAIILSVPQVSPLNPISGWSPLAFVILLSMAREGYEDLKRHKSDKQLNSSETTALSYSTGEFTKVKWMDLIVGDIVLLEQDDIIPADLIAIQSNDFKGVCYIETASLDGEKGLKQKQAILQQWWNRSTPMQNTGQVRCGPTNAFFHQFEGQVTVGSQKPIILNPNNLLFRGAHLRNTKQCIAVVCYTGDDTKIMQNAQKHKRVKQSRIELMTNHLIIGILVIQCMLCFILGLSSGLWTYYNQFKHVYSDYPYSPPQEAVINFFTYQVLLSQLIPISLVVSLEMVKLCQGFFIGSDDDIRSKGQPTTVSNVSINEELGQITHIFADKTGTLTQNLMKLHTMHIGPTSFASFNVPPSAILKRHRKKAYFINDQLSKLLSDGVDNQNLDVHLHSNDGTASHSYSNLQILAADYLLLLVTCHDCLRDKGHVTGLSPDEIALCEAAEDLSFEFVSKSFNSVTLSIYSQPFDIEVLESIAFDSDRKRMTVLIKHEGVIKLFCKGADNAILERLDSTVDQPFLNIVKAKLQVFSSIGLRTLCIACKIVSEQEFSMYNSAKEAINQLQQDQPETMTLKMKNAKMADIQEQLLENRLFLMGCTAVEDKLQEGVKETIQDILRANIPIWMLTGDKLETAHSIGKSCGLISHNCAVTLLPEMPVENAMLEIDKLIKAQAVLQKSQNAEKSRLMPGFQSQMKRATLIEGSLLAKLLITNVDASKAVSSKDLQQSMLCFDPKDIHTPSQIELAGITQEAAMAMSGRERKKLNKLTKAQINENKLMQVLLSSDCVVCCRATPRQKAQVVNLVRLKYHSYVRRFNPKSKVHRCVSLSIGDGANDVNMIEAAHVGIGIFGQEGTRAVQASDYAIPQFRFLWKLLFVHGRWSYIRLAEMIQQFFYKNVLFAFNQFIFAFFCAFSGQTLFDDYYIVFFNMVFTAFPLTCRAILEQDITYKINQGKYIGNGPARFALKNTHQGDMEASLTLQRTKKAEENLGFRDEAEIKKTFPLCYYVGQQNRIFTYKNTLQWMLQAVIHSIVLFFITYLAYVPSNMLNQFGRTIDLWVFSIILYCEIIFVQNARLCAFTAYFTWYMLFAIGFTSIVFLIAFIWICSLYNKVFNSADTALALFSSPNFYYLMFLSTVVIFGMDLIYQMVKLKYFPSLSVKVKKIIQEGAFEDVSKNLFQDDPAYRYEAQKQTNMNGSDLHLTKFKEQQHKINDFRNEMQAVNLSFQQSQQNQLEQQATQQQIDISQLPNYNINENNEIQEEGGDFIMPSQVLYGVDGGSYGQEENANIATSHQGGSIQNVQSQQQMQINHQQFQF